VGAIGFEFWDRCSFNNIESAAGTVKQSKAVVSSANGSQTDHNRCASMQQVRTQSRPIPQDLPFVMGGLIHIQEVNARDIARKLTSLLRKQEGAGLQSYLVISTK